MIDVPAAPRTPADARILSTRILSGFGDRWAHTQAVGRRAENLAYRAPLDQESRDRLMSAAWLHDIGYAFPDLHPWHPVAGARYLAANGFADIAGLVGWHSTAAVEGRALDYLGDLAPWPHEDSTVQDALDWADMTTGPSGQTFTVGQRLAEVRHRRGLGSTQYAALLHSLPRLEELELMFSRYLRS